MVKTAFDNEHDLPEFDYYQETLRNQESFCEKMERKRKELPMKPILEDPRDDELRRIRRGEYVSMWLIFGFSFLFLLFLLFIQLAK